MAAVRCLRREAANLNVGGSNPIPATIQTCKPPVPSGRGFRFERNREYSGEITPDVDLQVAGPGREQISSTGVPRTSPALSRVAS